MEEEWEIGEDEWVVGELIAPGGEGESPPLSDQATGAVSLPTPPVEEELEIGGDERMTGELEAPGGGREPPPPVPVPAPGLSVAQDYATAAAAGGAIIRNKRGRFPAFSKDIQGLREVTAPLANDDCCAICLQDFDSRPDPAETPPSDLRRLRAMPCSHTFHEHCIFEWLRRNAACPLCRHQLPTEEELDEEDQGRSCRRRVIYNPGDGRYHVLWYRRIGEHAFAGDEEQEEVDPEQERRRTELQAYLRDELARWRASAMGIMEQHQLSSRPQS